VASRLGVGGGGAPGEPPTAEPGEPSEPGDGDDGDDAAAAAWLLARASTWATPKGRLVVRSVRFARRDSCADCVSVACQLGIS
jgi:hypothetical protein